MEAIKYKIEVFEGPLDLLLYLISKHKLNINDIPIVELVGQYVDYVRSMQAADMEIASEFLEMAARLVYIKTVSLLPVYEQAEQLKQELTGELIEYKQCKAVARQLSQHADGVDYFCREPMRMPKDNTYTRLHEGVELFKAYISAVGKAKRLLPPPVEAFSGIVTKTIVSVSTRISYIYRSLRTKSKRKLNDFFDSAQTRSEMVATFLAMLELIKAKKIVVNGESDELTVDFSESAAGEVDFNMDGEELEY